MHLLTLSWKNILPLFLETSHFPFHPFITFTLRWWSRWLCLSYKTPSIVVLSLVNAGLFTQSSVDSPLRESSVRPLIRPATGLLVPRFNLSHLCLFLCLTLAIRLRLCECLQPFEACIDCCLNYVDVVREYTIERKTAASLWEKVLTYWCQEVGWSSPSIQPTFYQPELIAEPAFTLRSKDRANTRTRHILLNKICYHWHSTRYHLLFLFRLLHRPQGARSVASHSSLDVNFKMLLSLQERSKYVLSYSVHRCFPLVLNFFFWSSKILYGW
jgi:hypothetical protein